MNEISVEKWLLVKYVEKITRKRKNQPKYTCNWEC